MELKDFSKDVVSRVNAFMENYIKGFDDEAKTLKESMVFLKKTKLNFR